MNGGCQIRDKQTNSLSKELFIKVDQLYNSIEKRDVHQNELVDKILKKAESLVSPSADVSEMKDTAVDDAQARPFYTTYHAVESTNNALTIKW